jgi:hypothetical protein
MFSSINIHAEVCSAAVAAMAQQSVRPQHRLQLDGQSLLPQLAVY